MTETERIEYDNTLRKLAEERAEESETNAATEESTNSDTGTVVRASRHADGAPPD